MKILKMLSFAACAVLLSASANAEVFRNAAEIDATVIKSGGDALEATIKLPKPKKITYAHIALICDMAKPFGQTNASPTLFIDGKEAAAYTMANKEGTIGAVFVATSIIRDAIRSGKTEIDVKVAMRGKDQTPVKAKALVLNVVGDEKYFRNSAYLRPIFSGDETAAESVFPLADKDPKKPAAAKLLFRPTKVLEAYTLSSGKKVDLVQDKDYKINGGKIEFLPDSNVKIIPWEEMYFPNKEAAEKSGRYFVFDEAKTLAFFREGNWFHTHMVYISYKHTATNEKVGETFDEKALPNTLAILKAKKPLRVVLYGDSISHGANASGLSLTIPYAPSWGDQVAQELRKYYKAPVVYFNRALGGTGTNWGVKNVESLVCPDKPDLVIIAFGMNDRMPKEKFTQNISAIIEKIRKANPDAEVLLVSPMSANPLWHKFPQHDDYRDALEAMKAPRVAFADVRSVHKRLLKSKRFLDMTGNNVNHPNDFLIRVYAQTILQKLIPSYSR